MLRHCTLTGSRVSGALFATAVSTAAGSSAGAIFLGVPHGVTAYSNSARFSGASSRQLRRTAFPLTWTGGAAASRLRGEPARRHGAGSSRQKFHEGQFQG